MTKLTDHPQSECYCVGEKEYINTDSVEEAVQDWYDSTAQDDITDMVEVQGYNQATIKNTSCFDWALESLYENLDENYAWEGSMGDYSISDEAKVLWDQFVEQVKREYPVTTLDRNGEPFIVKVSDYIDVGVV